MIPGHPSINWLYYENSGPHLILTCGRRIKRVRIKCRNKDQISNIRYCKKYVLSNQMGPISQLIKESIRINDAIDIKNEYAKKKYSK